MTDQTLDDETPVDVEPAEPTRHPHSAGYGIGSKFPVDEATPDLVDGDTTEAPGDFKLEDIEGSE